MPQVSVTRRYRFSAAHRLDTPTLSVVENRRIFGKCNNPNGHGHNYVLFVTVTTNGNEQQADMSVEGLDRIVNDVVVKRFDHQDLNRDPGFSVRTTTGENLVLFIWELLTKETPRGRLEKVGIVETRDNYFEYSEQS